VEGAANREILRAMSQENVEIVRRIFARWAKGDFRSTDHFDPAVETHWVSPDETVTYGLEALGASWAEWLEPWDHLTMEAEELFDAGDRVVANGVIRARGHASGVETEWSTAMVLTLRDGEVVRLDAFGSDRDAALEAAGLPVPEK
jgi:ketosteroid isomerase-like protein